VTTTPTARPSPWIAAVPGLFVFLWSTGFIGGKLGLPHAEPFTFLAIRFAIVAAILLAMALAAGAAWPRSAGEIGHIAIAGLLVHGVYLGGVFASIHEGVSAGVSAIIVSIQPLLTAALAGPLLGERVTLRAWIGLVMGLAGVALVVWTKVAIGEGSDLGYLFSVLALLGMTAGTLYQKRFCGAMDVRTGGIIQFLAAWAAMVLLALAFETRVVAWTPSFLFALGWLVLALSIGAISLLIFLIKKGEAYRVATLFYLVPPSTAIIAWLLFDETLGPLALVGMAVAAAGVALVNLPVRR